MAKFLRNVGDITKRGVFVGYFDANDLRAKKDRMEIDRFQCFYPQYRYVDSEFLDSNYKKTNKLEKIAYNAVWITNKIL